MARMKLTMDNIGELGGGRARVAINAGLAQILTDLDQRGSDDKARSLVVKIVAKRVEGSNDIIMDVQTKITMPSLDSGSTVCKLKVDQRGMASAEFEPDSPDNPDQQTLFKRAPHPEAPDDADDDGEVRGE